MAKDYLTTTEAAKILSVAPDTVLKWVRGGKIKSYRTPGGHCRIPKDAINELVEDQANESTWLQTQATKNHQYCWEFLAIDNDINDACKECLTYKSRARRCYELRDLPGGLGCLRIGCVSSCDDCNYYKIMQGQVLSVLVLSESRKILIDRNRLNFANDIQVKFVDDEYECSFIIEKFRPDYIVVDVSFGRKRTNAFCNNLFNDPRIPVARLILASQNDDIQDYCDKEILGWLKKPFTINQLKEYIEGISIININRKANKVLS